MSSTKLNKQVACQRFFKQKKTGTDIKNRTNEYRRTGREEASDNNRRRGGDDERAAENKGGAKENASKLEQQFIKEVRGALCMFACKQLCQRLYFACCALLHYTCKKAIKIAESGYNNAITSYIK